MSYVNPGGYAENYADAQLPAGGDTDDESAVIGSDMTWWEFWQHTYKAYLAGFEEAMRQAREALR